MSYPYIFERKNKEFLAIDPETSVAVDDILFVTTYYVKRGITPLWRVHIKFQNGETMGWVPSGFDGIYGWNIRRDIVKNVAVEINKVLQQGGVDKSSQPDSAVQNG